MTQKVIQVGNSLAVTLPSSFVKSQKLKAGQEIFVEADNKNNKVEVKTKNTPNSGVTPEFKKWLDKFNEEHADLLRELAKV